VFVACASSFFTRFSVRQFGATSPQQENPEAKKRASEETISSFWASLTGAERKGLEEEALEQASPVEIGILKRGGNLATVMKKDIFDAYATRLIRRRTR
jgi:hypothetical protein